MRRTIRKMVPAMFAVLSILGARTTLAEEPTLSLTPEPLRYAYVRGDVEKFAAQNWMKDRYVGGIKDMSFHYDDAKRGIAWEAEGHALIDQNDMDGVLEAKKEGLGHIKVDYSSFRKYFDGTGGTYMPFGQFRTIELDRDLRLDIAKFEVEAALMLAEWPELTFIYERETKGGTKSRLTWATVQESRISRKTSPSWQEIDETVNDFIIKGHKDIAGFSVKGEQKFELVRADSSRYEQQFSTTTTASDRKIRKQDQEPQTDAISSTVGIERWFFNDKAFVSSGYRFGHISNKEIENIYETDASGRIQSFANAENVRNALGYSKLETHTWVSSFMINPWKWLESIGRFKTEVYRTKGSSQYPKDSTPTTPDGIINTTDENGVGNKILRVGEGVSLRYKGIPRTALYSELEMEQVKSLLFENRQSIQGQSAASAGETFGRLTATYMRRGVGKVGARFSPWRFADATVEVSHRQNNNDYDDRRETDATTSQAKSGFTDWQNISINEAATRLTLRPVRWFQPSFRYQLRTDQYRSGFEGSETDAKSNMTSNIYTFDVAVQPTPEWLSTLSYSRQSAITKTPARFAETNVGRTPAFYAGVASWLLSTEYSVNPQTTVTSSAMVSNANNFVDVADFGLPLASDYGLFDVTAGLRWSPSQDVTIEPKYSFYRYAPNQELEYLGGYTAHVVWLDVALKWPFAKEWQEGSFSPLKGVGEVLKNIANEYL